jgi:phospho-N-acetylmuramoyl-pentapeptide-transferase
MLEHFLSSVRHFSQTQTDAFGAFCTAFALVTVGTPVWIWLCLRRNTVQPIRSSEVRELNGLHQHKASTPTMGGIILIPSMVLSSWIWSPAVEGSWWIVAFGTLSMALMGGWDDLLKVRGNSFRGLSPRGKLLLQWLAALVVVGATFTRHGLQTGTLGQDLLIPWLGCITCLSLLGVILLACLASFTFVGATNAVNLTDGMDGLAAGLVAIGCLFFAWVGAQYPTLAAPELMSAVSAWASAGFGASLAFLIWNRHPARLFMGDTGSMGLGGCLASLAILLRMEVVLALLGGVFVVETMSVILQVWSFRSRGKRILRCAPLHHHFEMGGYGERTIVHGFWFAGVALALLTGWALA